MPFLIDSPIQLTNPVWKMARIRPKQAYNRLNQARRIVCPRSPFWCEDFDLDRHRLDIDAASTANRAHVNRIRAMEANWRTYWSSIGMSTASNTDNKVRPAFDARDPSKWTSERSAVLHAHTVFANQDLRLAAGWDQVPWPSREELQFEGQGRVSTERIHGRFLPLPREAFPVDVPWTERAPVTAAEMDDFTVQVLDPERIWFGGWFVADTEFTDPVTEAVDEEGVHALGVALLAALDPRDYSSTQA